MSRRRRPYRAKCGSPLVTDKPSPRLPVAFPVAEPLHVNSLYFLVIRPRFVRLYLIFLLLCYSKHFSTKLRKLKEKQKKKKERETELGDLFLFLEYLWYIFDIFRTFKIFLINHRSSFHIRFYKHNYILLSLKQRATTIPFRSPLFSFCMYCRKSVSLSLFLFLFKSSLFTLPEQKSIFRRYTFVASFVAFICKHRPIKAPACGRKIQGRYNGRIR